MNKQEYLDAIITCAEEAIDKHHTPPLVTVMGIADAPNIDHATSIDSEYGAIEVIYKKRIPPNTLATMSKEFYLASSWSKME